MKTLRACLILLLGLGLLTNGCAAKSDDSKTEPAVSIDGGTPGRDRDAAPDGSQTTIVSQPLDWDRALRLVEPQDLNPDPRILEVNLDARMIKREIRPGIMTDVWAYDGSVPGPILRLNVGDRLIVNFTNNLPEATTVHWHGMRLPLDMDGVPDVSQPPVKRGGTFRYDFVVRDPGLFWYHPHFNSAGQTGDGLYGAILVTDPAQPRFGDELVMVLSDISVDDQGKLRPHDIGGPVGTLFGREGDVLLVNGQVKPVLKARVGVRQRWRVLNAAKSRYFQLAAAGQGFFRIGGDTGLLETPIAIERPVVTAAERMDLVWTPQGTPGTEIPLRWVPNDRGYGTVFARPEEIIATIKLVDDATVVPPPLPATGAMPFVPHNLVGARVTDIKLTRNDVNGAFFLGINNKAFGGKDHIPARLGEVNVWNIENLIDWAHPFHLHGFFFQVIEQNGKAVTPLEWKDTIDVPAKDKDNPNKGKIKVAVVFDDRPGNWMFHCHILDHADAGMMGMVAVTK